MTWIVDSFGTDGRLAIYDGDPQEGAELIALLPYRHGVREMAAKMAAAEELLAACESVMSHAGRQEPGLLMPLELRLKVRDAIVKAKM